tara:strand:- start:38620 stop:38868 length:249 start_codon:yes stop_codon:yes gene_type:complete
MKIIDIVFKQRGGHYCHAIEVSETHTLEAVAEQVISEFEGTHTEDEIIEFLETLSIYYLGDDKDVEEAVYDFSFTEYIQNTI